ncbi:MAG: HD domain-containing protein [Oscillospiraceae bacterium]|jgi:metal-dependent HD superfamily phosphatase/phosphodiesterase|nr:HD domain-containing protein [Oscillospiraceae bacterium]
MSNVTYKYIRQNKDIQTYIAHADAALFTIGYTEHAKAHSERAAETAEMILLSLGYPERVCELAQIAAYMHDIGNVINRNDHAQSGAVMAFRLLDCMGMPAEEIAVIVSAIGNHDEKTASPVNPIAAAIILADKTDVRRSRVRHPVNEDENGEGVTQDVHDRVNYACVKSDVSFSEDLSAIILNLVIDEEISSIMEYFEIFLDRMVLCRKAAEALKVRFELIMNNSKVL